MNFYIVAALGRLTSTVGLDLSGDYTRRVNYPLMGRGDPLPIMEYLIRALIHPVPSSLNEIRRSQSSCGTTIHLTQRSGSGFTQLLGVLLKAAHRFDISFQWFNRKFDIEKHPLKSLGLVSGALVGVLIGSWC